MKKKKRELELIVLVNAAAKGILEEAVNLMDPQQIGDMVPFIRNLRKEHKNSFQKKRLDLQKIGNEQARNYQLNLHQQDYNQLKEITTKLLDATEKRQKLLKKQKEERTKNYHKQNQEQER